jgi:hypothetical protein
VQSGDDILGQLEGMVFEDESEGKTKEMKRKRGQLTEATTDNVVWKKKSVFSFCCRTGKIIYCGTTLMSCT